MLKLCVLATMPSTFFSSQEDYLKYFVIVTENWPTREVSTGWLQTHPSAQANFRPFEKDILTYLLLWGCGCSAHIAHLWRSECTFVGSVLSFYLNLGTRDWSKSTGLILQALVLIEPCHWPWLQTPFCLTVLGIQKCATTSSSWSCLYHFITLIPPYHDPHVRPYSSRCWELG